MAKPVRQPRKLREKLAEIAAKRDARTAEADEPKGDFTKTFYHAFLSKGSVHAMYMRLDEVHMRMVSRIVLEPIFKPRRITVPPPWEGTARDAAE